MDQIQGFSGYHSVHISEFKLGKHFANIFHGMTMINITNGEVLNRGFTTS